MDKERIAVVTGATNGIGKETALGLARAGTRLILVGRNAEKGSRVVAELAEKSGNGNIEFLTADLSSQAEIRRLSDELHRKLTRIDILVNNAGGFFDKRLTTADGLEMTFAFNHLGYFLLTNLLLDLVKKSGQGARIVNVSSRAHASGRIDFDDLQAEKKYSGWGAYANSKFANVLFTFALARRLKGTGITANCLHPGFVNSGFGGGTGFMAVVLQASKIFAISPVKGAETSLYLALDSEVEGETGGYYGKKKFETPQKAAYDIALQDRLWEESERLTKLAPTG
jgi:NAD(P)-dependent dehydrogenase (short-subunit alcohol dehydrogenase family)